MNTKEYNEKVVGHLQTKYDEKLKHHDKVVNKLNTKHSHEKMNTMDHHEKVVYKLNTKQAVRFYSPGGDFLLRCFMCAFVSDFHLYAALTRLFVHSVQK